jgi:predicted sulfurtransferase
MEESGVDKEKDVIVSFCTGGIRCEKGAPILKRHGYKNTYQLQGGILGYFNDMKEDAMKYWEGECFVFDRRVSVDHNWQPSKKWTLCHVCREPLDDKQREDPKYKEDVSNFTSPFVLLWRFSDGRSINLPWRVMLGCIISTNCVPI